MADTDLSYEHQEPKKKQGSRVLPWLLFTLSLCALGALGYYGYGWLEQERARADDAMKQYQEAREKIAGLEAERKLAMGRAEQLEGEKSQLATERDALNQEVEEKEAELAKLRATYDDLEDKMKDEISKGEIRVTQGGGKVQVDLVDKILFPSGEAALSEKGQEVLSRIGAILGKVEDKQIQVSGHTDDSPIINQLKSTYPSNWELSASRAVNVVRFLAEKGGVPAKRLVAAGYGEFHPIATNANPTGRARNRRIEILLTPALDAKAAAMAEAAPAAARPAAVAKPAAAKAPAKTAVPAKATTKAPAKKTTRK